MKTKNTSLFRDLIPEPKPEPFRARHVGGDAQAWAMESSPVAGRSKG